MSIHGLRTNLNIKFICAKCKKELSLPYDKIGINARSAFDAGINIPVEPCSSCISRAEAPLRKMKEAFELLNKGE